MNFAIRVDSSEKIGIGHVHRCMKLARVLKENNNKVTFLSSNLKGNINTIIKKKYNLSVIPIKNIFTTKVEKKNHYKEWKKSYQLEDALKTLNIIKKIKTNFTIVDHYGLSESWHKKISKKNKLIVIDDFLNKKIFSDIYVNYHFLNKKDLILKNIIKSKCTNLLGPKYALLNKIKNKKKNFMNKKVFIYLGSVDSKNVTTRLLNNLKSKKFKDYFFTVLIGKNNKNKKTIIKDYKNINNFSLSIKNYKNLQNFYKKNTYIFSGTGVTLYEQIQCDCNVLSIFSNKNQKKLIQKLNDHNLCKIADIKDINQNLLVNFLNSKKNNKKKNYFDGNGPNRIFKYLKKINYKAQEI